MRKPQHVLLIALCIQTISGAGQALAAASWETKIGAANQSPAAPPAQPVSECASIVAGMQPRLNRMRQLKASIAAAETGAPTSLLGYAQKAFGYKEDNGQARENERQLRLETRSIEDINSILVSQHCVPVDIKAELAKPPTPEPEAKKKHKKVF